MKLSKEGLQKDEEQNTRFMKEKIVETDELPFKWRCVSCDWKGKYHHKAKSHARDCGSRVREQKKRSVAEKYECSARDCSMSFAFLSELKKHYRSSHFKQSQSHHCIPCKKGFSTWSNFRRHNINKHGKKKLVACEFCDYQTERLDNLNRHVRKNHGIWQVISALLLDVIDGVVDQFDKKEGAKEKEAREELLEDEVHKVAEKGHGAVKEMSKYEQLRMKRIAEIQEEFKKKFPDLRQELAKLKMPRKKTRGSRKVSIGSSVTRRSSRFFAKGESLEVDGCGEEDEDKGREDSETSGKNVVNMVEEDGEADLAGEEGATNDLVAEEIADGSDQDASKQFRCIPCNKSFRDTANLRRHEKLIHQQRETPLPCPRTWCLEEFYTVADVKKHKDTCWLVCPYEGCSKVFDRERFFAAHQRAHKILAKRMVD